MKVGKAQHRRILSALMTAPNQWMPSWELSRVGGTTCLPRKIKDLRDEHGIEISTETRKDHNGHKWSGYRLVTPRRLIDWDTLSVRSGAVQQGELGI